MTPKKRGRRPKAAIWSAAPRSGPAHTLGAESAFRAKVRAGLPPRALEIGRFWFDTYIKAGGKMVNGRHVKGSEAAGIANKATAKKFGLTVRRIQKIITEIEDTAERLEQWAADHEAAPPVLPPREVAGLAAELLRARQALIAAEHRARKAEAQAKKADALARQAEARLEKIERYLETADPDQSFIGTKTAIKKIIAQ